MSWMGVVGQSASGLFKTFKLYQLDVRPVLFLQKNRVHMHLHASFLWYSMIKGCNSNYLLLSLPNLVVDCGDPGDPYGGYRHLATDTKYQAKVTYTCKADHHLEGDESQTCQADGQWSGTKPVCLGMHSWLNKIFLMTSLRWATFSWYQTKKNIDFLLGTFRFVPKKAFLISSVESPRKDYHIFQL